MKGVRALLQKHDVVIPVLKNRKLHEKMQEKNKQQQQAAGKKLSDKFRYQSLQLQKEELSRSGLSFAYIIKILESISNVDEILSKHDGLITAILNQHSIGSTIFIDSRTWISTALRSRCSVCLSSPLESPIDQISTSCSGFTLKIYKIVQLAESIKVPLDPQHWKNARILLKCY
jgi:hypothetical protein